jgi:hypothetical protein
VSFFLLSLLAFRENSRLLFYGLDGRFEVSLVTQLTRFVAPQLALTSDFIHGLGNISFPFNPWLIPAYVASLAEPGVFTNFPLAYAICATELFVATYAAARLAGFSRVVGLIAAWTLPLLAFQYVGWNKVPTTFRAFPHYATIAGMAAVAAGSLLRLRDTERWRALAIAGLVFLGISYIVIVAPTLLILVAPPLAGFGMVALCGARDRRDLLFRAGLMATVAAGCLALGYAHFLAGLVTYTAADVFRELGLRRVGLQEVSMLFWNPLLPPSTSRVLKIERVFVALGLLGGAWAAWRCAGVKRAAAAAFLGVASLYLAVGLLHTYHYFWFGPPLWYFEGFLLPYHAIFAAFLVTEAGRGLVMASARGLGIVQHDQGRAPTLAALLLPWIIAMAPWPYIQYAHSRSDPPDLRYYEPHPQPETPITRILKDETALSPGSRFRGRVAGLTGRIFPTSANVSTETLWFTPNLAAMFATGNTHDAAGLWQDSVPTLLEPNPLMTPAYFAFTRLFFTEPGDVQIRNWVAMRRIDPRLLAAVGVRFVVTDAEVDGLRPREMLPVSIAESRLERAGLPARLGRFVLYLYELPDVNVGQYSPTETRLLATAADTVDALADSRTDLSRTLLASESMPGPLSPATLHEFVIERGAFRVRAASDGRSVLVLPLEFSRCLHLASRGEPAPSVRLFRADLLLTGVLFERTLDATLVYRTGPLVDSRCRLRDRADMEAIGMQHVFERRPQFAPTGTFAR